MSEKEKLVRLNWDETPPQHCRGGAVAVGNFDGVHRGHASLVRRLCEFASRVGGQSTSADRAPAKLLLALGYETTFAGYGCLNLRDKGCSLLGFGSALLSEKTLLL